MTFDREIFFDHLGYDAMRSEHIDLLKEICEHVDDDTLSRICVDFISSEHDTPGSLADRIVSMVDNTISELSDYDIDDDDLKDGIKDGFGYIYTVYDIGAEDIAIDMLKDVADALHIAQSKPYFGTNTGFLEELENELRECLGSDNPFDWFEYTGETGSDPASAGALNMYRSLEHMITKDLRNEFLALASDPKRVTEFQGFLRDRVLDNLDTYLETVLSYNTAIETCIGDLMDSEFDDEDDAYAYILDDASLTAPYLLEEFTNAFSFLIFIDDIGMHDDAMAILKDVLDAAENLADDDDERTVPCLRDLCNSIGASIDDDDVTGWMDEDMLQLHTLLFSY